MFRDQGAPEYGIELTEVVRSSLSSLYRQDLYTVKKSVLKIQEYIHEGANLKFYIPEFFNFKLLIPEYSPICRFWFQTAAYFLYSVNG
jgi:hypothetical protein